MVLESNEISGFRLEKLLWIALWIMLIYLIFEDPEVILYCMKINVRGSETKTIMSFLGKV